MSNAIELSGDNFDSTVASGVTLVDFWAEWCGPCRMITPILEELASEYSGKLTVAKINVDDEPELAQRFNVRSIPTIVIMKDGEVAEQIVGTRSKQDLLNAVDAGRRV